MISARELSEDLRNMFTIFKLIECSLNGKPKLSSKTSVRSYDKIL